MMNRLNITITKFTHDNRGKQLQMWPIMTMDIDFKSLVFYIRNFQFVSLCDFPHSKDDQSELFKSVSITTGPCRINKILSEFVMSFKGDPKYWKWALICTGLVK